jgi:hypothetical protein
MPEPDPEPRAVIPRRNAVLADAGTLVALGVLPEQRKPPPDEPPGPPPAEQANLLALNAALADAGVTKGAADTKAITALSKLDAATVEAIASWVKHRKKDDPIPPVKA